MEQDTEIYALRRRVAKIEAELVNLRLIVGGHLHLPSGAMARGPRSEQEQRESLLALTSVNDSK